VGQSEIPYNLPLVFTRVEDLIDQGNDKNVKLKAEDFNDLSSLMYWWLNMNPGGIRTEKTRDMSTLGQTGDG